MQVPVAAGYSQDQADYPACGAFRARSLPPSSAEQAGLTEEIARVDKKLHGGEA